MKQRIARFHDSPNALSGARGLARAASWPYAAVVASRNWLYDQNWLAVTQAAAHVVSIGNLTTGGTGKTPVTLALAERWQAMGKRVVILTRGYGARQPLAYGRPQSPDHGDEAYWLQCLLPDIPVIVGRHRADNARRAVEDYHPDILLLDDGFQYRRLARDVNIALIDAERLFGNGALLPVGPLREPLSALRRADALWLTKTPCDDSESRLRALLREAGIPAPPIIRVPFEPLGLFRLSDDAPLTAEALADAPTRALCGIAHPASFERTLAQLGLRPRQTLCFADHHAYDETDVAALAASRVEGEWLATTEKDAVKLKPLLSGPLAARTAVVRLRAIVPPLDFSLNLPL